MTTPEDRQTFHAAAKPIVTLAVAVAGGLLAIILTAVPVLMFILGAGGGDFLDPSCDLHVLDPPALDPTVAEVRWELTGRILHVFVEAWRWIGTFPPCV